MRGLGTVVVVRIGWCVAAVRIVVGLGYQARLMAVHAVGACAWQARVGAVTVTVGACVGVDREDTDRLVAVHALGA